MIPGAPHLSSFDLDALALGALTPGEETSAKEHLYACARCQKELEEVQALHKTFTREVMPQTLPALRRRAPQDSPWRRLLSPAVWVPSLAVLVFAVALAPSVLQRISGSDREPQYSVKGGPAFRVFAKRQGRVFAVKDGSSLAPGDEIRFTVAPAGAAYLMIASIDGAGNATLYVPYSGSESVRLDPAKRAELPGSITLDAAPGPERVFALFSSKPLSSETVLPALRAIGARGPEAIRSERKLPVSAGDQQSIHFEKMVR